VLPLPVRSFSLAKELGAAGVERVAAVFERRLLGEQALDVLVAVGKAPLELLGAGGQRSLALPAFRRARLEARVLFQQLLLAAFELGSGARILSAEAKAATGGTPGGSKFLQPARLALQPRALRLQLAFADGDCFRAGTQRPLQLLELS